MKSRRRGRARKASWNWATTGTLIYQDTNVTSGFNIEGPLFPAPRVDWLLENGRGRDHLVVTTILLWLDFIWTNPNDTPQAVLPIDFYVLRERFDSQSGGSFFAPYQSPQVPGSVTSWVANAPQEEFDGLDPFLWTHHLSEYVAGNTTFPAIAGNYGNTTDNLAGPNGVTQPNLNVRAAWQPDVIIKSRRRLGKGDCLNIGFGLPIGETSYGNQIEYNLAYRARILTT